MYKYGKIMVISLGIALVLGLWGAYAIGQQKEAVFVSVENVQGDPALVEDIVYTAQTNGGQNLELWWTTEFPLPNPENRTTYCQPETEEWWERDDGRYDTQFEVSWERIQNFAFVDTAELVALENRKLQQVVTDIYSRFQEGESYQETVLAADCGIQPKINAYYDREGWMWESTNETTYLDLPRENFQLEITLKKSLDGGNRIFGHIKPADSTPRLFATGWEECGYFLACADRGKEGALYRYTYSRHLDGPSMIQREKLATLPPDWDSTGLLLEDSRLLAVGSAGLLSYDMETGEFTEMPLPQGTWSGIELEGAILLQNQDGQFGVYVWQESGYVQTIGGTWSVEDQDAVAYGYTGGVLIRQVENRWFAFTLQCYGQDGRYYSGEYAISQNQEKSGLYASPSWRLYRKYGEAEFIQCHTIA